MNCIIKIIGDNNPDHFFVVTQDIDLREKCRKVTRVLVLLSVFLVIIKLPGGGLISEQMTCILYAAIVPFPD